MAFKAQRKIIRNDLVATCDSCRWRSEDYNAIEYAAQHTRNSGHETRVILSKIITYVVKEDDMKNREARHRNRPTGGYKVKQQDLKMSKRVDKTTKILKTALAKQDDIMKSLQDIKHLYETDYNVKQMGKVSRMIEEAIETINGGGTGNEVSNGRHTEKSNRFVTSRVCRLLNDHELT